MFLIKNGRIWDGEKFFYGDVLTDGDAVSQIGQDLTCEKGYVFDAKGCIVVPGLVDGHIHMHGLSIPRYSIPAESACFPFGVTAAADAGSTLGSRELLDHIAVKNVVFPSAKIVNGSLDRPITLQRMEHYGDKAIGIKLVLDTGIPGITDGTPLYQVCDLARELGCKVLVHCTDSPIPMAQIVEALAPGDILTHIYHGGSHTCLEEDFAAFRLAREKGVVLDAGFAGHVHTDFGVLKTAAQAGFYPDTISTDITRASAFFRGGRYGLTMAMSMAKAVGMPESDIFRSVTTAAAHALGQSHWGRLQVGGIADIAVLEDTNESFFLKNSNGNTLESQTGYRCVLTLSNGVVVHCDKWR